MLMILIKRLMLESKKKKMSNSETYIKQLPFMVFDSGSKTLGLGAVEIVSKRSICYGYLVDFVLSKYIYIYNKVPFLCNIEA